MGQKAVVHSITEITGTENTGEILVKIDVSILEETTTNPLRDYLNVTIAWTDTLYEIEHKIHDAILTYAYDNNYLDLTEKDILMQTFMKGTRSHSTELRDTLQSVHKMRESRLELMSMINNISNNTITNDEIISTLKKLATIDKSIIDMLVNIS
jgi:hypothetical protein